ncbi:hypothetical protein RND81_06G070600 [Saponaria officinalis]|uniref:Cytochrome P450 n=1 Tax=Saponaria officinalis TaxID=3572 RepID=A0AAW1K754_SAPOF
MSYLLLTFLVIILSLLWQLLHKKLTAKLPPGPYPLPIIGNLHMLGPLPHRSLAKLAQKYGPIMSLKLGLVQTIVVSSPEAAELFLKQHDTIFASRPATEVATHMFYGAKDMGFAPYGDYWRRVRKICTLHLLTTSKVEGFESLRRREIEKMVQRMKEVGDMGGSAVEVGKVVGELIEEITFKMVVGKGKDEDKSYELKGVVGQTLELAGAFNFADFLPFLAPFVIQGLTRMMKQLSKVVDEILEDIIEDHLKEESFGQQQDILGSMLTLMNKPNDEFTSTSFGRDNIKAVMLDLFSAGIDTTSHTITWAISALLKNPRAMKLLQQELDDVVGKARMIQESDLPKLPYLDMVAKETLRLYPVGPLLIPRESMQDVVINGWKIPKKSRIIINFWAIARDAKFWLDTAEVFYPERFMGSDADVQGNNYKFFPFGSGRRKCPGIQLGLVTLKIVLASVVHCFNLGLPHGMQNEEVDMAEKFGLAMGRANELFVLPSFRLQLNDDQ